MNSIWLLRMAKWAKRPPSEARVKFVIAILLLCILLATYEWIFGWPEWLTPHNKPKGRI